MNTAFNKVIQHSEGMFDYMFRPGKVTFLLDGYAAGSAGKGKLESLIVKHTSFDNETKKLFVATTNSANASHWVYDDGKKMMFEVLPSSAYLHEKLSAVYICHGASFSVERLMEELKISGLPKEKLRIHPKAGIIQKIDEDYEKGLCDVNGKYYAENEQTSGTIKGGCFDEESMILMSNGTYKSIKDVKVGDYVMTSSGTPKKVLNVIDNGIKDMVKVSISCWHKPFYVTPEHEFLIGDMSHTNRRHDFAQRMDVTSRDGSSKYKFKPIKDIDKKSMFLLTPNSYSFDLLEEYDIDMQKYCKNVIDENNNTSTGNGNRKLPKTVAFDYDLGYIFGMFLGDGNSNITKDRNNNDAGKFVVNLGIDEISESNKLKECVYNKFGINGVDVHVKSVNRVTFYSLPLARMFWEFGKKTEKHLPNEFLVDNEDYLEGLLDGLLDSDGYYKKNGSFEFTNTSEDLCKLIYTLLNCNKFSFSSSERIRGYLSSTLIGLNPENCKTVYNVNKIITNRRNDNYWYSKLKSYDNTLVKRQAYDLEIEDEHNFVCNNVIVHNSTCSGSGAVRAKKCVRNKTVVYAMDVPELKEFIVDTEKEIIERLSNGECGLLQIGQGFPLSYGLGYNKKNSTSRNVTIAAALDDALIPPFFAGNVILNGRTFPIKINNKKYKTVGGKVYEEYLDGEVIDKAYPEHLFKIERSDDRALIITRGGEFINSFEMEEFPNYPVEIVDSFSGTGYSKHWNEESKQEEITWDDVEAQYGKKIPLDVKCTSLTKLIRRVFKFDKDLLDDGIIYNMPPEGNHVFISINFVNWVDCEMEDKTDVVTDKAKQWIIENMGDVLAEYPNVGLAVLGTGRESDAFVAVDPFSPEELSE